MAAEVARVTDRAWEQVLRAWFLKHEGAEVPPEPLVREHARWLVPQISFKIGHRVFQWKGQTVLEGWLDTETDTCSARYVIHPHTPSTHAPQTPHHP